MLEFFLDSLVVLTIVVDPIGIAPLFAALTLGDPPQLVRATAIRGTAIAGVVLIGFAVVGDRSLQALSITTPAFQIAGGILLFLIAVDMLFVRHSGLRSTTESEQREAQHRKDISVFPLAIPLIAGPGAMTTVLLKVAERDGDAIAVALVVAALLVILPVTVLVLLSARRIVQLTGETGANVVTRVLGVVLAALAVQYVIDGVASSFGTLRG
jgi:multiple antibiotic resistance protein